MEIQVQRKGKEGRKGASAFTQELKAGQDACLRITHPLKHHSVAVKSQAGELVASLCPCKQGEEEAD